MIGSVSVVTRDSAFAELVTVLLEEVGFTVRVIPTEAEASDNAYAVVDLDTASIPVGASAVTVSCDPFRSCDLIRPFYNTRFVALCLSRFASLTEEDALRQLPADLLSVKKREVSFDEPSTEPLPTALAEKAEEAAFAEELLLSEDGLVFRGERIVLTPLEYKLFACLFAKRGEAVTEAECVAALGGERNKLTVYINHLRGKLDHRFGIRLILTVRKVGYMLK